MTSLKSPLQQMIYKLDMRPNHIGQCPSRMHPKLWTCPEVYPNCIVYGKTEKEQYYVDITSYGAEVADVDQHCTHMAELLIRVDNSANCAQLSNPEFTKCYEWIFNFVDISQEGLIDLLDRALKDVGSIQLVIMALRSAVS